ncbi:MAG TPA: ABC transporter permease [Candidatus Acidoferrum sp.]
MGTLRQDIRYALRLMARSPGFVAAAVLTLALGIGANTAIFSVVYGVLLRPLPYVQPDRLVKGTMVNREQVDQPMPLSDADFLDWKSQNQAFENLAAYTVVRINVTGMGEPEQVRGVVATPAFFATLGVGAELGRTFLPAEDGTNSPAEAVLGHAYWLRRFRGDAGVIGRAIVLNGRTYTIVGVMPPDFQFPDADDPTMPGQVDIWRVLHLPPPQRRGPYYLWAIARMKPGMTLQQGQSELDLIGARIAGQNPLTNQNVSFRETPLQQAIVGDARPALLVLLGAVAFVLLIGVANVANLLLARSSSRQRELAVRAALGASGMRLLRQLLTESLVLAALGGALGLLISYVGLRSILSLIPANLPRVEGIHLDGRVLAFTTAISLLSGVLFGLAPALQQLRHDLNEPLQEGGRSLGVSLSRGRTRALLVVGEIALSLILLAAAGLLLKSFLQLEKVDGGVNPDRVMTMQLTLPQLKYRTSPELISFYDQLLPRVAQVPGVASVGLGMSLPPNLLEVTDSFTVEGSVPATGIAAPQADLVFVSADYFRALGVPLLRGRSFLPTDRADAPPVCIINQTLAQRYWPGEDPVGKRIKTGGLERPKNPWLEVVGVVGDMKFNSLETPADPTLYQPYQQAPWSAMYLVFRGMQDPRNLVAPVRAAVWSLDKDLPVARVRTMDQLLSESVAQPRFRTWLIGLFGCAALLLAAVGVYGVVSYSVTERTREFGVRVALGARPGDVLRLVIGQGLRLAGVGVALGLVGAFLLTRLLAKLLFAVKPYDPLTFSGAAALLSVVVMTACYLPARRATRVDPQVALRYE